MVAHAGNGPTGTADGNGCAVPARKAERREQADSGTACIGTQ